MTTTNPTLESLDTPVAPPPSVELIGVRPGFCGGEPHVLGHRIKVRHVAVWFERKGMSADEIVATYPTLTLAQVYAALAYYHTHRDAIDADIAASEKLVAEMKANVGPSLLETGRGKHDAQDDSLSPR